MQRLLIKLQENLIVDKHVELHEYKQGVLKMAQDLNYSLFLQ